LKKLPSRCVEADADRLSFIASAAEIPLLQTGRWSLAANDPHQPLGTWESGR